MTPEQAKFLLDYTLETLKKETAITAKVMAATPNQNLDYRPSERCTSASDLLWHIAAVDMMFIGGVLSAGETWKAPAKPDTVVTPQQISEWYAQQTSDAIEKMSAFTPEQAAKVIGIVGLLQAPAAGVLNFALAHSIHHRGQLSTYIRPMGGKVPSIYGASGDENPRAKSEAQSA